MKFKKTSITLMAAAAVFMVSVEAVGQRRGGGSRGGGSRGGSINRTPSMSRPPTPRPNISRPSVQKPSGQRPSGQRPSGQRPNVKPPQRPSTLPNKGRPSGGFPNKGISPNTRPSVLRPSSKPSTLPGFPSSGKRPSVGGFDPSKITNSVKNRYPSGSQKPFMPDWYKPGASQLPSGGVTKPATRPGTGIRPPATNLPAKPGIRPPATNLPAKPGIRPPGYRPPGYRPPGYRPPAYRPPAYRPVWHPWYRPGYTYRPGYWWRPATAVAVSSWFVWAARPVYYSYGNGGTVYYEGDTVYVNGEASGTANEYYESVKSVASSVPEISEEQADKAEWMPLGVFAVVQDEVEETAMLIQLAVNKEGVVAGTFYNETTEKSIPLEGMVDKETQRVAWKSADKSNPDIVMETGLYNLTKETAPVLVHFGADETQTWNLVRIEQDEEAKEKEPDTNKDP